MIAHSTRYVGARLRLCLISGIFACAGAGAGLGCGSQLKNEQARTSIANVRATSAKDCPTPAESEAIAGPILTGRAIDKVRPLYLPVGLREGDSEGVALAGAVIQVRPIPGVTAQELDRALACHGASQSLARESATSDPFWLPGRGVSVRVSSEGDELAVYVEGVTQRDAETILSRAQQLAGRP
jgi:hypothetical protein